MPQPNEGKRLNFVAKVRDPVSNRFVPVYIAPDATDTVQGDVKLSDATNNKTLDASTGMTAASPKAVALVQESANNKVDKTTTAAQSIASDISIGGTLSVTGDITGNASSASKIKTPVSISINSSANNSDNAVASFDGSQNITLIIRKVGANLLEGVVPIENLPKGALERLVKVQNADARFALTTDNVQLGDTVQQIDTGVMYLVIDENNLDNESGYQDYKAGTASSVPWSGITGKTGAIVASDLSDSVTYAEGDAKNGSALTVVWNEF